MNNDGYESSERWKELTGRVLIRPSCVPVSVSVEGRGGRGGCLSLRRVCA